MVRRKKSASERSFWRGFADAKSKVSERVNRDLGEKDGL